MLLVATDLGLLCSDLDRGGWWRLDVCGEVSLVVVVVGGGASSDSHVTFMSGDGYTLLPEVEIPDCDMVFSDPDPTTFGVVRSKDGVKSLLDLPMLAVAIPAGVFPFLKELPWSFVMSLFECREKP